MSVFHRHEFPGRQATWPERPRKRGRLDCQGTDACIPGGPADAAPTATRRPDEIRFAPGQSHEPGKSDTHRSVSWLTGHCTRHTFPDGHRRPVVVERTPLMSRARRLQLQGQPQNWPGKTSLRSRYRHALSASDFADAGRSRLHPNVRQA